MARRLTEREVLELERELQSARDELAILRPRVQALEQENPEAARALDHQEDAQHLDGVAAGIGHNLNNMMSGITPLIVAAGEVYEFLIKRAPEKPSAKVTVPGREWLRQIEILEGPVPEARSASQAITGMAEEAATVTGQAPMERISLEPKIRQAIEMRSESGVQFAVEIQEPLPLVRCTPVAIIQILTVLLVNAIEASGRDATVLTGAYAMPRNGVDGVVLFVADRGSGMSENVRRRIFEPLYTTKGAEVGRGMGLSRTRRLVRYHKGEIQVLTVPGRGTTVEVWLPLEPGT